MMTRASAGAHARASRRRCTRYPTPPRSRKFPSERQRAVDRDGQAIQLWQTRVVRVPIVPLRDEVVFPEQRAWLMIGRRRSLVALARADEVLVVAQRDPEIDEPGPSDLREIGCVAELMRAERRHDGGVDVLLRGLRRARAESVEISPDLIEGGVTDIEDDALPLDDSLLREYALQVAIAAWGESKRTTRRSIEAISSTGRLADVIIGPARLPFEERLELLEELRPAARVGRVLAQARQWQYRTLTPDTWLSRLSRLLRRSASPP